MPEGINDWFVHLIEEEPKTLTTRVILEVIDRGGNPDPAMAPTQPGTGRTADEYSNSIGRERLLQAASDQ